MSRVHRARCDPQPVMGIVLMTTTCVCVCACVCACVCVCVCLVLACAVEELVQRLWKVGVDVDVPLPFPHMSYRDAIAMVSPWILLGRSRSGLTQLSPTGHSSSGGLGLKIVSVFSFLLE